MTRKEISEKMSKMHNIELKRLLNRYENNEIDIETLDKLFAARTDEFVQHVKDLALANDEELKEKMSFIINADLETF
jgi:hypothetical protein